MPAEMVDMLAAELGMDPAEIRRKNFIQQAEFVEHIGPENILPHVEQALQRAEELQAAFAGVGEEFAHDMRKIRM